MHPAVADYRDLLDSPIAVEAPSNYLLEIVADLQNSHLDFVPINYTVDANVNCDHSVDSLEAVWFPSAQTGEKILGLLAVDDLDVD